MEIHTAIRAAIGPTPLTGITSGQKAIGNAADMVKDGYRVVGKAEGEDTIKPVYK